MINNLASVNNPKLFIVNILFTVGKIYLHIGLRKQLIVSHQDIQVIYQFLFETKMFCKYKDVLVNSIDFE